MSEKFPWPWYNRNNGRARPGGFGTLIFGPKIFFGQKQFKGEIQDSYSNINTIPEFIEWKPEISLKKSLNKTLNK